LFSKQLADAVAYLTKHAFVHRDIAARNCLVSTPKCVKLSDFGMCRLLDDEVYNCKFEIGMFDLIFDFSNKSEIASKVDAN
jgi:serine/threonine protein kinase